MTDNNLSLLKMQEEIIKLAQLFRGIGEPNRLRLLYLFLSFGEGLCVCELVDALLLPQYTVSRHLSELRKLRLVKTAKRGLWVYYMFNYDERVAKELLQFLHTLLPYFREAAEDLMRLEKRIALRQNGHCVVGFSGLSMKEVPKKQGGERRKQKHTKS